MAANGTLRGIARQLRIDKDTVTRYLVLLAQVARQRTRIHQAQAPKTISAQFDDLITIEHTKMEPLSVLLASDTDRWQMLGCIISRIPASGYLAEKARK